MSKCFSLSRKNLLPFNGFQHSCIDQTLREAFIHDCPTYKTG